MVVISHQSPSSAYGMVADILCNALKASLSLIDLLEKPVTKFYTENGLFGRNFGSF